MTVSSVWSILVCGAFGLSGAVTIASMDQGAEFTKCINNTDYHTKTINDDITLIDRDANGCCPAGSTAGVKHTANYRGAQVICGFKTDGTIATSESTTNSATTCVLNKCYVHKQNLECEGGGRQLLNGCCGTTTGSRTFKTGCSHYERYEAYGFNKNSGGSDKRTQFCLTYRTQYTGVNDEGTALKTDDQADGKLDVSKLNSYRACTGGNAGSNSGTSSSANKIGGIFQSVMVTLMMAAIVTVGSS